MRLGTSEALLAWNVLITRWPVPAASMAARMVSESRISPMTMMSGSCRTAACTASMAVGVSVPTLRCEMMALLLK